MDDTSDPGQPPNHVTMPLHMQHQCNLEMSAKRWISTLRTGKALGPGSMSSPYDRAEALAFFLGNQNSRIMNTGVLVEELKDVWFGHSIVQACPINSDNPPSTNTHVGLLLVKTSSAIAVISMILTYLRRFFSLSRVHNASAAFPSFT